jgi:hypothetical protein
LDYSQHVGFGTDPARVRSPKDKPRVERVVQYVRGNFWAGETFIDLADAQARAQAWCRARAGMRFHGTTKLRPADPGDLPEHKAGYAMRDLTGLIAACADHGPAIGIFAERILDDPLPWTRMRSVYRLQGLVRRYGPDPVETACARALDLDVVSVSKIAAMPAKATEAQAPILPAAAGTSHNPAGGRFARDPDEYSRTRTTSTSVQLTLIPGGSQEGQP